MKNYRTETSTGFTAGILFDVNWRFFGFGILPSFEFRPCRLFTVDIEIGPLTITTTIGWLR